MKFYKQMNEEEKATSIAGGFDADNYCVEVYYSAGGYNHSKGVYVAFRNVKRGEGMFESTLLMHETNFHFLAIPLGRKSQKKLDGVVSFVEKNIDIIQYHQQKMNKIELLTMIQMQFK